MNTQSLFDKCKNLVVGTKLSVLETKTKKLVDVMVTTQRYDSKQMEVEEYRHGCCHDINYSDVTKIEI